MFFAQCLILQIPDSSHTLLLHHAVAAAIITGYGSLVAIAQIRSAFKKKPAPVEEPAPAAPAATTTGIPAVDSPEFEAFVSSDAFTNLLENEDQLTALLADK